jgi:flagellar secretion chaperone FliS
MNYGYMRNASAMYEQNSARGRVEDADRHQLTLLLLDSVIDRINQARGYLGRRDLAGKAGSVSRALAIVSELRESLDHNAGGELSQRLESLYEFVSRRLLYAQARNDDAALEESARLMTPIRDGWREIRTKYLAAQAGPK